MEGILLLLVLVGIPAVLFVFGPALAIRLFTGMTPKEYATQREIKRRADMGERIINDYKLNLAAVERLRQQGRL